eukprot:477391-Rhodomonas_salina.1
MQTPLQLNLKFESPPGPGSHGHGVPCAADGRTRRSLVGESLYGNSTTSTSTIMISCPESYESKLGSIVCPCVRASVRSKMLSTGVRS